MTTTDTIIRRAWAMPSPNTFSIKPIAELLDRWLEGRAVIVDPFARDSRRGTITNDLNPETAAQHHTDAVSFLYELGMNGTQADAVLIDPPYSPRQIAECYQQIGKPCSTRDTQNARLYREVKDTAAPLVRIGGIAICCGWSGCGFGEKRGFELRETLVVVHGGAHSATIVTVEEKMPTLFDPGASHD